jgi:hypothetical protein
MMLGPRFSYRQGGIQPSQPDRLGLEVYTKLFAATATVRRLRRALILCLFAAATRPLSARPTWVSRSWWSSVTARWWRLPECVDFPRYGRQLGPMIGQTTGQNSPVERFYPGHKHMEFGTF